MKEPKKQEIAKNMMLAKFVIGAGSALSVVRIIGLCDRHFNPKPYTRPIGMYDVVGILLTISLAVMGVCLLKFWKKKNEDQDTTEHDNDSTEE